MVSSREVISVTSADDNGKDHFFLNNETARVKSQDKMQPSCVICMKECRGEEFQSTQDLFLTYSNLTLKYISSADIQEYVTLRITLMVPRMSVSACTDDDDFIPYQSSLVVKSECFGQGEDGLIVWRAGCCPWLLVEGLGETVEENQNWLHRKRAIMEMQNDWSEMFTTLSCTNYWMVDGIVLRGKQSRETLMVVSKEGIVLFVVTFLPRKGIMVVDHLHSSGQEEVVDFEKEDIEGIVTLDDGLWFALSGFYRKAEISIGCVFGGQGQEKVHLPIRAKPNVCIDAWESRFRSRQLAKETYFTFDEKENCWIEKEDDSLYIRVQEELFRLQSTNSFYVLRST